VLVFALLFFEFGLVQQTSSLSLSIFGMFKELVTILLAAFTVGDVLSPNLVVGFSLTVVGILAYHYARWRRSALTEGLQRNDSTDESAYESARDSLARNRGVEPLPPDDVEMSPMSPMARGQAESGSMGQPGIGQSEIGEIGQISDREIGQLAKSIATIHCTPSSQGAESGDGDSDHVEPPETRQPAAAPSHTGLLDSPRWLLGGGCGLASFGQEGGAAEERGSASKRLTDRRPAPAINDELGGLLHR